MKDPERLLGANYLGAGRCSFLVWAPAASRVELHLVAPVEGLHPLQRSAGGYWHGKVDSIEPGARYFYRLNGEVDRPDPASKSQPDGVHQASEVVDPGFPWSDRSWFGLPLREYILYELHVGTFTSEATFEAVIRHLPSLRTLGVTAIELMPVAQFPGERNWGYDGVDLFAVQNSYGGPHGLKTLVNACHEAGLAVVLDVVYNHFGPEGNYLREFGPYFSEAYKTLWGSALNFDGPHSDEVRRFFLENALYWQTEFHVDALRLDAVHAIRDFSATPFLQELVRVTRQRAEQLNRRFYLIAESDLNNPRLILPEALGGLGLDAQWSDDFHHCLHVLLTGETRGYYQDFGGLPQMAKIFREGYAYTGQHSHFRQHRHGASPHLTSSRQFVVYAQNHDQIGNRPLGDRLTRLTSFEGLKLAAGCTLLSPFIPMLFMGEDYGERAPFQYTTSHSDLELVAAVRDGRRHEFEHFHVGGAAPDPQAEATFQENKLDHDLVERDKRHRLLREFHRALLRLRKETQALASADKPSLDVQLFEAAALLLLRYSSCQDELLVFLCFAEESVTVTLSLTPGQPWQKRLDSAAGDWGGEGSLSPDHFDASKPIELSFRAKSVAVFQRALLAE